MLPALNEQAACGGVGQVPEELDRLRDLYRERQPKTVLEIGVWFGGTLRVWLLHAALRATVVAIDPEHLSPNLYEEWRQPDTKLVVGTGRSSDPHIVELIEEHAPYDWIFIDGDHSEDGVKWDAELAKQYGRAGGLILLHDIAADGYPPLPPLIEYEKLRGFYDGWEIVAEPPDWYPKDCGHGIGVIQL